MFFKPQTAASTINLSDDDRGEPYELYSDYHKDAIGCRPGAAQMARYNAMSPEERLVEHKHLGEWMQEDGRISKLAEEVARFRLSRTMEYVKRREGLSDLAAFKQAIVRCCNIVSDRGYTFVELSADWEHVCYLIGLPYSDAEVLNQEWERLTSE